MDRFVKAGPAEALAVGARKLVFADGQSILLLNVDGQVHAIENSCPHSGASLASGQLDGPVLQCPAHGLRFDLRTGCMPGQSDGLCLRRYGVSVENGELQVDLGG